MPERDESFFPLDALDHFGKIGDGLELLVDRRKTDIGNGIDRGELAHDCAADLLGRYLGFELLLQMLLDALGGGLKGLDGNRALATSQPHALKDFLAAEIATSAVALDDEEALLLDALYGAEAAAAGRALAATANRLPVRTWTRVEHLEVVVIARRAAHRVIGLPLDIVA